MATVSGQYDSKASVVPILLACFSALALCCPGTGHGQEVPTIPDELLPRTLASTTVKIESETSAVKVVRLGAFNCELPCELSIRPGNHQLSYLANGEHGTNLVIPASGALVTIEDPRIDYYVWGGILIPVGLGIGSTAWLLMFTCGREGQVAVPNACILAHQITWPLFGAGLVATGIYLLAATRRMAPRPVLKPLAPASLLTRYPLLFDVIPSQAGLSTSVAFRF